MTRSTQHGCVLAHLLLGLGPRGTFYFHKCCQGNAPTILSWGMYLIGCIPFFICKQFNDMILLTSARNSSILVGDLLKIIKLVSVFILTVFILNILIFRFLFKIKKQPNKDIYWCFDGILTLSEWNYYITLIETDYEKNCIEA